ncbi:1-acyl-sn-glycerol-3-phosphate acyltransferase [Skermania piniformis]|uniref:1-acyl-sn-glycerol-3-phosphate acyltransferase n=1 Tax=Skermania pinensis TaxID=39122 RepID=A0ABX8S6W2_9ACTN|nr:1-acyl-sn-glycerol-3-phosphate acyltransferase [Skermania piniformis]QXQ13583.1 1-acyl-sn-glycerol-3-phosphate acyltransferase [Skermania piniformis]
MNASDNAPSSDAERLSQALRDIVDEDRDREDSDGTADPVRMALSLVRKLGVDFVRRYNRLDIDGTADPAIEGPVLFVANHGFGGLFDLNILAIFAALTELGVEQDVVMLTHQSAWTLKVGKYIEPLGARPASRESAEAAFAAGAHVLVLPGGDLDAFKTWSDRNKIVFGGRRGFVRLALDAGVPIVPIVTAGGGESVISLSSGARLARVLGLDKSFRLKAMPITLSFPLGLSVGGAGMLPYVPLPTKLSTSVLPPMTARDEESAEAFGDRIEALMQDKLTAMTENRTAFLG